ncbi:MAG TPA: hypothetical protein VFV74_08135 [Burkholderiales bacterium]|nr:hypothetical protein [Burkholderiales bacterium]
MRHYAGVLVAGAAFALAAAPVGAAPQAQGPLECSIAADMAVVAKSLAAEKIARPKADTIMERIYRVSGSPRGKEMMKEILDAAYALNSAAAGGTAQHFAESLFASCLQSGGDMDGVLGERL